MLRTRSLIRPPTCSPRAACRASASPSARATGVTSSPSSRTAARTCRCSAPGGRDGACTGVLVAAAPLGNEFDGTCYPTWNGSEERSTPTSRGRRSRRRRWRESPRSSGRAAELRNYQVAGILNNPPGGRRTGPRLGMRVLDAAPAVELALSRSSAESAADEGDTSSSCSVAGTDLRPGVEVPSDTRIARGSRGRPVASARR